MRAERFWHAERLLETLETGADESPEHLLLAARAAAGWKAWGRVRALLEGREWLPALDGGVGLALLARALEAREAWEESAAAYASYLAAHDPSGGGDREVARIRLVLVLARAGAVDSCVAELDRVRDLTGPFVASWAALGAASHLAEEGNPEGTRLALRRISDEAAAADGRPLVARAFLVAGDSMRALESYRRAADVAEGGEKARLEVVGGRLALALADTAAGIQAFRRALAGGSSRGGAEAAGELLALNALDGGDEAQLAADALLAVGRGGKGLEALELAMTLEHRTPADLDARARLRRASLLAAHGSADEAARELSLLAKVEDPGVAGPALWQLARLRRRQGRPGDARALEDRLVREFPGRPEAVDVVFFRGDDAHDRGLLGTAERHYRQAVEMAPDLDHAGLARMRLAQIRQERGDVAGAVEVFEDYLKEFPEGRRWDEAGYWAARGRLELADTTAALEELAHVREAAPLSYYAVQAARVLGDPYQPASSVDSPPAAAPGWLLEGLADVDLLRLAGLDRGARVAVSRLAERAGSEDSGGDLLLTLAEALNRRGFTLEGINLGWQVRRTGRPWSARLLRIVYPLPFPELLRREAHEGGVDPFLVAAIIRQESAFRSDVTSAAGAVGLMQVLPSTAAGLARSVGPEGFRPEALTTPEVNLHLGVRFFAQQMERFGSDLPLVLSAYNAGPSRAVRWREFPEARDPLRFTERIPFGETRDYVKNVVRNRAVYEWLYGDDLR